jgi:hypothetical protein
LIFIREIRSQDWPCGNPASNNYQIPSQNNNFLLRGNSIAVDPNHPNIILSASTKVNTYPDHNQVAAFISTNWGISWSAVNNGVFDQNSCGDPTAAIDLNGRLYVAYLGPNASPTGPLKIAYSSDLGNTWTTQTTLDAIADNPHIHADNSCNSQIMIEFIVHGREMMLEFTSHFQQIAA